MGLALQIIGSIILFLIFVAVVIIETIRSQREGKLKGVRENAPFFINIRRPDFTGGYCLGRVIKEIPRKNDCNLFEIMPIDWEKREGKKRPAMQSVVMHKNNLLRFPRGEVSSETEQIWAIPDDPSALPKKLRDTWLGKKIGEETLKAFVEKTFAKSVPQSQEALTAIMNEWTSLGMTQRHLSEHSERVKEIEKMIPRSMIQGDGRDVGGEKK